MAIDRRLTFVKKWFQRAVKADDPFEKFFFLWIALIVAAQRIRTRNGTPFRENDTDREKVLDYFRVNSHNVSQALQENQDRMVRLAQRRGTNYENPIVDTGNPELQDKFSKLAAHYIQNCHLPEEKLVEIVAELLNKIRNNLFHGGKVYDDREDIALLDLMNPVLLEILRKCESYEKGE